LFRRLRYDLAEVELRRELAEAPANALAHALLGLCLGRLRRLDEALNAGREAVRLAPESAYAHYALAYLLDDHGRLEDALAEIGEALRRGPRSPDAYALLAFLQARQRDYPASLAAAEAGLAIDPGHGHCLNRRALALAAVSRPEEAEAVIRSALSDDPRNPATLAHFGWVLMEQQKPAPALEQFVEALSLDPQLDWARQKAVDALVLLVEQGLQGQALKYFPEALRRDPDLEDGRQRLVVALKGRLPDLLGGCLQALWLLGCYLTLGGVKSPRLGGLLLVLMILYVCVFPRRFALIEPIHFLLLRFWRLGRRVLSREQMISSVLVGVSLMATLLAGAAVLLTGDPFLGLVAVVLQSLVLPTAWLHACPAGRARSGMAAYLALLAIGGAALIVGSGLGAIPKTLAEEGRDLMFLHGAGITGLLGRALIALYGQQRHSIGGQPKASCEGNR
jgi:tetratricopeptide (TPR) repeat protein